jgi:hypothetical protein
MGTNQDYWNSTDGSTTFYFNTSGKPLYDYTGAEGYPAATRRRDGCHGLKLFVESRGYSVTTNFNQYIYPYGSNTEGFSLTDFKNEIDNYRPVLIQVTGHTMLGYGYNDTGNTIYVHDTWDEGNHTMTWGGTYGSQHLTHYGVTVLQISGAPLQVRLSSFSVRGVRGEVKVRWETASEVGTLGFYVLRAEGANGPFVRINTKMIPATAQPGRAGRYEFVDRTARPGRVYYYRLAQVSDNGKVTEQPETAQAATRESKLYDLLPPGLRDLVAS